MLGPSTAVRFLLIIVAMLLIGACDDDDEKKDPEYEVEIYYSKDVKIRWFERDKNDPGFKKPRIHVDHPKGVATTHDERPPRRKTVYDFAPIALPAILILLLAAALRSGRVHPPHLHLQAFSALSPPVYQRG